jgi:hypothetical protein
MKGAGGERSKSRSREPTKSLGTRLSRDFDANPLAAEDPRRSKDFDKDFDDESPTPEPGQLDDLHRNGNASAGKVVVPESMAFCNGGQVTGKRLQELGAVKENERDRRRRINREIMEASNLFSPDSAFRRNWDMAQIALLAYVALGVPYRLGFDRDVELWSFPFFYIDICVDIYFAVDLYVSMRTAFYNQRGDLVVSQSEIRTQYMARRPYWFFIDLMACFPGQYIVWIMQEAQPAANLGVLPPLCTVHIHTCRILVDKWVDF